MQDDIVKWGMGICRRPSNSFQDGKSRYPYADALVPPDIVLSQAPDTQSKASSSMGMRYRKRFWRVICMGDFSLELSNGAVVSQECGIGQGWGGWILDVGWERGILDAGSLAVA